MKILFIIPYVPYPLNSGGNQAFFTITDHVRKEHEVSVLLYVHHSNDLENVQALRQIWTNVTFYIYDQRQHHEEGEMAESVAPFSNMSWMDRTLCKFFSSIRRSMFRKIERRQKKYAVVSQKEDYNRLNSTLFATSDDLDAPFCQFVQKVSAKGFDAIQVEFYEYLPLVLLLPKEVRKIFVHHEIRFVRNENELQLFRQVLPTDTLLFEKEKAFEVACLSACDAVVTLTETDKQILGHYIPAEKIFASPAIIHIDASKRLSFKPVKEMVFIGSGDHFPNADAVIWFCKEIMPILKERMAEVPRLNIVGRWRDDLKTAIMKLCPEACFTGFVEDLSSYINGKLSVVPVRIGSGMRIKILDSIFAAAPIVTTSKGCEGLPMADDVNCLIADSAAAFADAISRVIADQQLQQKIVVNALASDTGMLNEKELIERRLSVYREVRS